jgi:hypothetical protein
MGSASLRRDSKGETDFPFEHPPSGTEGYYFFDREPV